MYLALYRKYRPQTFEEVIGQDHIVKTLINQIKSDKIGHAYLFCGSRGTGKTSTAKIFAKAINCLNPKNGSPCLECEVCKALAGNNMDVLEIDAASNNGVDEIRDLREKVKYPPVNGKYKVYIIDEVHMLSPSAFNALLKTLEEPPSYAVFVLATTEVHKIPATILSRLLRFDFGLVSVKELSELVNKIFEKENILSEEEAVEIIARAGEGSVRDTLSIADRCVSYSQEKLTYKNVVDILGTTEKESLANISEAILSSDLGLSLSRLDDVLSSGKSPLVLSKDLISYFRDLLVINTLENAKKMVVANENVYEIMKKQATDENYNRIITAITSLSEVEAELRYSISPRIVLETAIIKTLSKVSLEEKIERLEQLINGGASVVKQQSQAPIRQAVQNVENSNKVESISVEDGNLLGKLLSYLREHKDMSLLACVRQVKNVNVSNNLAEFYVDDQMTLDVINREKYKSLLTEFFDSLGLKYIFKLISENSRLNQGGRIGDLNNALGGRLEVK